MIQKSLQLVCAVIVLLSCTACKREDKPKVTTKDELYIYLDSLEKRYETACMQMELARWNMYSKSGTFDFNTPQAEFIKIFSDTTACKTIEEWRNRSGSLADKLLTRRLELWHRCFIGGAIYSDPEIAALRNFLEQKISNFKLKIDGSTVTLQAINTMLQGEKKQTRRRKIWLAAQPDTEITSHYLHLVRLYNEKARTFGFPNYYSLVLHLEAIDEKWLLKTLNSLEEHTHLEYEKSLSLTKKKLRIKEFGRWDMEFVQRDAAALPDKYFPRDSGFTIIHRFEKGIGFKADSLPIKETINNISLDGTCLFLSIPNDVRIIIKSQQGVQFYRSGLHEYGSALRAIYTNVDYPILKGYNLIQGAFSPAYEEGVAQMHEGFIEDSLWLAVFTKAKEKKIKSNLSKRALPELFKLRIALKEFFTEYEIYKNPDQDIAGLDRIMFKKYLLADSCKNGTQPFTPPFTFVQSACSNYKYILRMMIATQLHEALTSKFGNEKISNRKVALWMIEHLYKMGETLEWHDRIRGATGKSVEPGAYLRQLGIEQIALITKKSKE